MRITCPVCGTRDLPEFTYEGDASVVRPAHGASTPEDWLAYIFDRENPRGPHREYWQHTGGCRAWLAVTRNTLTHEVLRVDLVGAWAGHAEPWIAPDSGAPDASGDPPQSARKHAAKTAAKAAAKAGSARKATRKATAGD